MVVVANVDIAVFGVGVVLVDVVAVAVAAAPPFHTSSELMS